MTGRRPGSRLNIHSNHAKERRMRIPASALKIGGTVAVGIGVVILAPVVVPAVARILKPAAKAAVKGSLVTFEKARVAAAEAMETLEDLAAEAKAELAESDSPDKAPPKKASKGRKTAGARGTT
jgi:hypothetical protein